MVDELHVEPVATVFPWYCNNILWFRGVCFNFHPETSDMLGDKLITGACLLPHFPRNIINTAGISLVLVEHCQQFELCFGKADFVAIEPDPAGERGIGAEFDKGGARSRGRGYRSSSG